HPADRPRTALREGRSVRQEYIPVHELPSCDREPPVPSNADVALDATGRSGDVDTRPVELEHGARPGVPGVRGYAVAAGGAGRTHTGHRADIRRQLHFLAVGVEHGLWRSDVVKYRARSLT